MMKIFGPSERIAQLIISYIKGPGVTRCIGRGAAVTPVYLRQGLIFSKNWAIFYKTRQHDVVSRTASLNILPRKASYIGMWERQCTVHKPFMETYNDIGHLFHSPLPLRLTHVKYLKDT